MEIRRVSLNQLTRKTVEEIKALSEMRAVRRWPIFMLYSLSIIFLLRISQLILGWSF